jgi:hypothetical protein
MIWLETQTFSTSTCERQDMSADTSCTAAGTLANGAGCVYDYQCSSGYCQGTIGTYQCGTCTARVAVGGTCEHIADCDTGLWCSSGTCKKSTAAGQACKVTDECADGSNCQGGVCKPTGVHAKKAGETCQVSYECVEGLACENWKCAEPVFANAGDSCGMSATCGNGLICTAAGKCVAYAPNGSCANSSYGCVLGQYCNTASKCVDAGGVGDPCQVNGDDSDCVLGLTCVQKKCGFLDAAVCK